MEHLKEKYVLERAHELRRIPAQNTSVHYMNYAVLNERRLTLWYLEVPCRAKLHHAMTGLFYAWDWKDESDKDLTEEEAMMLKHIFTSQKEYKLWGRTLKKINKDGIKKAKQWLIEQVKVLAIRNLLRGKD